MTMITELYRHQGPFASVVIRMPSSVSDAAHRVGIRWKNARRDLETAGASEALLSRFDQLAKSQNHHDGEGLAAVFTAEDEPFVEALRDDPNANWARLSLLPTVTPFIASRQSAVPHVVVFTDRAGADLVAVTAGSIADWVVVEGEVTYIHRGQQGGWSQRRFQQRAENLWESNAHEVADAVTELANRVGARLISVSGDVRAVGFLCDHLPTHLRSKVLTVQDGAPDAVWAATDRAVADLVQGDTDKVLQSLADRRPHRMATTNVSDVVRAVGEGRVETLLVHDDGTDDAEAWFGPGLDPTGSLHPSREDLRRGRLVDVCVRSAVLTDAKVRILDAPPSDEGPVAALLRW
jgi:hypothetical protein